MIQLKIKRQIKLIIIILLISGNAFPLITESELQQYGNGFLSKLVNDNPDHKQRIMECLNGIVKGKNSGIKLVDKFGLFLYDCKKNGVMIHKTKFYSIKETFVLFIIFRDKQEGEYTLFLEYEYNRSANANILRDIYFSLVYNEKKDEIENFFKSR